MQDVNVFYEQYGLQHKSNFAFLLLAVVATATFRFCLQIFYWFWYLVSLIHIDS